MSRERTRTHWESLLRLTADCLPRGRLGASERWQAVVQWESGARIAVEKLEGDELGLSYSVDGAPVRYTIRLASSPRHFGGAQHYLRCPSCDRACAVLRMRRSRFVCQRCSGTVYRVQSLSPVDRELHRFRKLRARVSPGTENNSLDWFPRRPKRMSPETYKRTKRQAQNALERYYEHLDVRLAHTLASIAPEVMAALYGNELD